MLTTIYREFTGETGKLHGYDIEPENWRIQISSKKLGGDKELGLWMGCPCCHGNGHIHVCVECEEGSGCEHEGDLDCETCNCEGWCKLQERDGQYYFTGWDSDVAVEVPEVVLKAWNLKRNEDPKQLYLEIYPSDYGDTT